MTTMPTIDDHLVNEFRRTGKRWSAYSTNGRSRLVSGSSRVVPQEADCSRAPPGTICWVGPCDPATRRRPVLRCNNSNGCAIPGSVPC
jgi:hypothetical protein